VPLHLSSTHVVGGGVGLSRMSGRRLMGLCEVENLPDKLDCGVWAFGRLGGVGRRKGGM
jgi:hypothetical protein